MDELMDDDFLDESLSEEPVVEDTHTEEAEEPASEPVQEPAEELPEDDFVTSLLRSKGILDRTKINFETEDGEIEQRSWDDLDNDEKFNIINQQDAPETGLEADEIALINSIRQSGLSPLDYFNYIQSNAINNYLNNQEPQYSVDQYTDEELFVADMLGRLGNNITQQEALNELDKEKENPDLFKKKIDAIRNEYKAIETENLQLTQVQQLYEAQLQYNKFVGEVANQINDFTEFLGYNVDLDKDEVDDLYEFITGVDAAGVNHFAKALTDPKILVQTAWLALNGRQMIDNITDYYNKEITKVRKESYKKGVEDTNKKNQKKSDTVYKKREVLATKDYYDLEDDF